MNVLIFKQNLLSGLIHAVLYDKSPTKRCNALCSTSLSLLFLVLYWYKYYGGEECTKLKSYIGYHINSYINKGLYVYLSGESRSELYGKPVNKRITQMERKLHRLFFCMCNNVPHAPVPALLFVLFVFMCVCGWQKKRRHASFCLSPSLFLSSMWNISDQPRPNIPYFSFSCLLDAMTFWESFSKCSLFFPFKWVNSL